MGYIDDNLLSSETVIRRARVHWIIFLKGALALAAALFLFAVDDGSLQPFPWLVLLVALALLGHAWIFKISTELALTNKRVIAKIGFIARSTVELNLNKVESLSVDQSIAGRIFNYGLILVRGTGGVSAPFSYIAAPLSFRKAVNEQIEVHEESGKAS